MPRGIKKTCIPGLFCIENMTFFLLLLLLITVIYMYYANIIRPDLEKNKTTFSQPIVIVPPENKNVETHLLPLPTRNQPLVDLFSPPLKNEQNLMPINISTRGPEQEYQQMGIISRDDGSNNTILPLLGRKSNTGRDKYQYYTMTNNGGNINTKLPLSIKGKSCSSDLGCEEIYNGDNIYVEGYNDTFRATIYENSMYKYIPF